MDEKRGLVKALHLEVDETKKKKTEKEMKELPECDILTRGWMHKIVEDGD